VRPRAHCKIQSVAVKIETKAKTISRQTKTKYKAKTPLNPESRIKRRLIVIAINLLSWSLSKEKTSWLFNGLLNQPISL